MAVRPDGGALGNRNLFPSQPHLEVAFFDDFCGAADDVYDSTALNTGTFVGTPIHGGGMLADSGGAGDGDGITVFMNAGIEPDECNGDYAFEARVRFSSDGSTDEGSDEMFIGLASRDTTLIASDAMDQQNAAFVGFTSDLAQAGAGGNLSFVSSGTADAISNEGTAGTPLLTVSGTSGVSAFVRLGFRVANGRAQAFINGKKVGSEITTNLPSSQVLQPAFVAQTGAEGQTKFIVDYVMVAAAGRFSGTESDV